MSKYNDLELPVLMDLLVKHTEEYTKMVTYKVFSVEEFAQCKQKLNQIHDAINQKTGNSSENTRSENERIAKKTINPSEQYQGDERKSNQYSHS